MLEAGLGVVVALTQAGTTYLMSTKDKRTLPVVVSHDEKETTLTLSVSIEE
jgi:hypothetical protein